MSPSAIWFCVGVGLVISELVTLTFVLVFMGIGAFASALFSLYSDDMSLAFLVFSLATVASLLLFRKGLLNKLDGKKKKQTDPLLDTPENSEKPSQVGRIGTVTQPLEQGNIGEISLGGSYWRAVAIDDIAIGQSVTVLGHIPGNDIVLQVAKLEVTETNIV